MILVTDDLSASDSCRWNLEEPTPRNVARLLRRLDAQHHTVVALRADEDKQLIIRGGAGQFVVCARDGASRLFDLIGASSAQASTATLNVGGTRELLPSDRILDAQTALTCALTYLYTAQRDPRFNWRQS
jgi:hypothetical protein